MLVPVSCVSIPPVRQSRFTLRRGSVHTPVSFRRENGTRKH
jgi:hypothetical protein